MNTHIKIFVTSMPVSIKECFFVVHDIYVQYISPVSAG